MRKIAAFSLGIVLAYTLGYMTLHSSFLLLSDWLGPLVGDSLLSMLTLMYILLGDPLQFMSLAVVWGLIGVLSGVIIRRRLGATLTVLLIFLAFIPALAASTAGVAFSIADIMGDIENPLDVLPPLPKGLTLATFFEAPLIGGAIQEGVEVIQGGGPQEINTGFITQLLTPILGGIIVNPIILIITALVGVELGKLIEPQLEPYTDSLRSSLGGNSVKPAFILLLIIVSSGVQPVYGAGDGFYGETVVGLIDEKGMGVLIDMFMDSEASIGGVDWDSTATEGLMVSVLATHDGIIDAVDISEYADIGGFDPSSMLGIIPSTALVSVYLEVPLEVAESRADEISEAFSSFYGIPVARMLSFEQELPLENFTVKPTVSIVVYQSSAILEDVASQVYAPFSGHGGLVDIIEGAVDNSRLIPGKTENSADGTALVTGFINAATILDELMGGDIGIPDEFNGSETIEEILPLIDGPVVFSGGVSIWEQGVEITPEGYSFDLLGLLGFTSGDPEFSEDADFSFFGIFDLEENEEGDINPNGFVAASLPSGFELDNITDDLGGMGDLIFSSPGDSIPSSYFNVPVTGESLPLMVEVSKEVSYMSTGDRVQVTVTVENMDMDAMVNVNLDDSATNNGYPLSVSIQSGITTGYWATIQPGASESIIYTLELGDPGIYSLSKAQLEYNHNDKEYTKTSNSLEVKIDRPNPLSFTMSSFGLWWRETTELLDMPTGGQGGTILSGAVLLGLAVLGILEVLNIRKWLQG